MNLVKAGTIGNIRILDPAATQPKRIKPRRGLIVILAALLGGVLSIGWILIARAFTGGLRTPTISRILAFQCTRASIPLASTGLRDRIKRRRPFHKPNQLHLRRRDLVSIYEPADPVVE